MALVCLLAVCVMPAPRGGHAEVVGPARGGHAEPETTVDVGRRLAGEAGWWGEQWRCLYALWNRESGWRAEAINRGGSGATGIPQALPGSKMASAGPLWRTDAATQIRWGIGYVTARYGSPCAAWSHSNTVGWY